MNVVSLYVKFKILFFRIIRDVYMCGAALSLYYIKNALRTRLWRRFAFCHQNPARTCKSAAFSRFADFKIRIRALKLNFFAAHIKTARLSYKKIKVKFTNIAIAVKKAVPDTIRAVIVIGICVVTENIAQLMPRVYVEK